MKIFKNIIILLFSLILGIYFGTFLYSNYLYRNKDKTNYYKIYLLEVKPYDTYDNMVNNNPSINNYLYYVDEKGYHIVLGITENENNLSKIGELFKDTENITIREELIDNMEFIENLRQYDNLVINGNDTDILNSMKQITSKYGELILNNEESIN